jgi:hypothetical protein
MTTTDSAVYYDPYDFEIDTDPYPIWRRLREEQPLYYNERYDFYALSRFEDVEKGLVDWRSYSSAKGTVLALWQNAGNGLYAQQDKDQKPTNYHARLTVAPDGSFAFSTVRPVSYTVPDDGPAGDMLRALGREAWRPAHLHMIIHAPGHKPLITEFFPEDDKYLDRDAVFGVRGGLVLPFRRVTDRASLPGNLAARDSLPMPVWSAKLDLTLPPA